MKITRVTSRRRVLALGFFGVLAAAAGCNSGMSQADLDKKFDVPPGKSEAEARKKAMAEGIPGKNKKAP